MSDAEALADYVRRVADLIGLRDWKFTFAEQRPDQVGEHCTAAINPTPGRKWACLWFPNTWWDATPAERRQTVIHELIHLHTRGMAEALTPIQTNLGDVVWGTLRDTHKAAEEYAVDAIADALAPGLPLPPDRGGLTTKAADAV